MQVYDCTGKKYLGISSGLCTVVEHHYESGGDLYETVMSHYMGSYGHLSCQVLLVKLGTASRLAQLQNPSFRYAYPILDYSSQIAFI